MVTIKQINYSGYVVATFESLQEASDKTGFPVERIEHAISCRRLIKHFKFEYEKIWTDQEIDEIVARIFAPKYAFHAVRKKKI